MDGEMSRRESPFSINTFSYMSRMSAAESIGRVAALGFRSVELMLYPGHLWPSDTGKREIQRIRRACAGNNISIASVNIPNIDINIAAASIEARHYSLRLLEKVIRLGGAIGARMFVLGTGRPNLLMPLARAQARDHIYAAFDRLCPVASAAGIAIVMENVPFCFIPEGAALAELVAGYGNPDIGIVYDIANAHFIGEDIASALDLVKSRLELVHLSDTTRSAFRHAPVGDGDVPFAAVASKLTDIGYAGGMVIEIIADEPEGAIVNAERKLRKFGFVPSETHRQG